MGDAAARVGPSPSFTEGGDWTLLFLEQELAFLDALLRWTQRGDEESGIASLAAQLQSWIERARAAHAAGRLTRPVSPLLGEWAAAVQAHVAGRATWAVEERGRAVALANPEDFALLATDTIPKLDELARWMRGIGVMARNICFNATFPDVGGRELPPLNLVQKGFIVWSGKMSQCLDDLFGMIARHRVCCVHAACAPVPSAVNM